MFDFKKNKHVDFASLANSIPPIRKRRQLGAAFRFLKYFGWLVLSLLAFLLIIFLAAFVDLKEVYSRAMMGKGDLEQSVILIKKNDFQQAAVLAEQAEKNFNLSVESLNKIKARNLINRLPAVSTQTSGAESLLVAAQALSKAVYHAADFGGGLESLVGGDGEFNFLKLNSEQKRAILKKIFESGPELNGIKADLDLAYFHLAQIETNGLFYPIREKIDQLSLEIEKLSLILEQAVPMSQLTPALAGYPKASRFLVLLENSDELRPTGGFLGTYGVLKIENGDIIDFTTHDIYHLDMPAQNKMNVEPPEPLKKYLNKQWYLRDANWSPDWPTAAKKILWFYELESRLGQEADKDFNFDGVIALTPKLIKDFLAITGAITVENQTYNQDNFSELLEYRVEKGYEVLGVSKWQRKEVIGEIAKELKIKIFDLPANKWAEAISAVSDNLLEKNLLLYFKDSQLERLAAENDWAGEIKNIFGDYLMVVDANLAALKTDAVMERTLDYKVSQNAEGLFARLNLGYSHNGKTDWKTSAYKSYSRIYVPLNSRLVGIDGYSPDKIDSGVENGKTWFGFYLTVEPGKNKNFTIEYKLPASITDGKSYSFYLQKQPGKDIENASVDLTFLNNIKSYSPANLSVSRNGVNGLRWHGDLNIDKNFEIKF